MNFNKDYSAVNQLPQDITSSALPCMIAVINDISSNPRLGLTRPIGDWLPWLQDQGYTTEGFDQFFLALLSDGGTDDDYDHVAAEDFVLVESSYHEAISKGSTTLSFIASLNVNHPIALQAIRSGLAMRIKEFSNLESLAGGKLSGPPATWIKHHPALSTSVAVGLAFVAIELICSKAERKVSTDAIDNNISKKQVVIQNVLENTVNQEAMPAAEKVISTGEDKGIDISRGIENFEESPEKFINYNVSAINDLRNTLLTKENIDRFVNMALMDEVNALLDETGKRLVTNVRAYRNFFSGINNDEADAAFERLNNIYIGLVEKLGSKEAVNQYLNHKFTLDYKRAAAENPEEANEFRAFDNTWRQILGLTGDRYMLAYKNYIKNGSSKRINKAADALLEQTVEDNVIIQKGLDRKLSIIDETIEEREVSFAKELLEATKFDLTAALTNEYKEFAESVDAYLIEINEDVNEAIENRF